MTTGSTGSLVLVNPSKLSTLKDYFTFSADFNVRFNNERKGVVVKDFFDDVITDADYVFNQHTYYNKSFSMLVNSPISDHINFAFAYAKINLHLD